MRYNVVALFLPTSVVIVSKVSLNEWRKIRVLRFLKCGATITILDQLLLRYRKCAMHFQRRSEFTSSRLIKMCSYVSIVTRL